ncbi:hypothetical protein P7228_09830 [Altererythrobacter arenosus]|uniref:ATP-grasp domain-containing protein n=1 Tax=Altererythrobacter arenosus TaxID=3032592 RepID=A0ABY8FND8_9SPHN|nr:hypothetical protein [Altererythrobacter sp. CAU 1644]WFL76297.1 hypothetical protein P7228_09830 [Altererythrobacter sp. CAU 1644]
MTREFAFDTRVLSQALEQPPAGASLEQIAAAGPLDPTVPLMALGGGANGVAVARNLGRLGVRISAAGGPGAWATRSNACVASYRQPRGVSLADFWRDLLLSEDRRFDGHVLLPLCDDSITFVCHHHEALSARYLLESFDPALRLAMLDKRETLVRARDVGVPVPKFWEVASLTDLDHLADELVFPLMIKPIHSHLFVPVFGRKLFIIESGIDAVREKLALAFSHGLEVMLVEMIPGPDDLLSSYNTYVDGAGGRLFEYTKCVVRRYPVNRGGGTYHRSIWLPETAEMGRRFFDGLGWRGMGNVEFKRDPRDGKLKVIECNPRLTAAQALAVASGVPTDELIYRSITGQHVWRATQVAEDVRMLAFIRDAMAFLELRRRGELNLAGWLRSLLEGRKVPNLFRLHDPMPGLVNLMQSLSRALKKTWRSLG